MRSLRLLTARAAGVLARRLDGNCVASYAQEGEDVVLRRLLEGSNHGPGFYLDVGAHHPFRFSNTYHFYEQGWRGINIEPAADAIAQFNRLRPRDLNIQIGVAEAPGKLTYYVFDEPALNTFDATLMRAREANTPYRVVRTEIVPVERLDAILRDRLPKGQAVTFMSIDVEGLDLQVLRSNDWAACRPEFVLTEALDFRLERAAQHPLHSFMHGVGYELVAKTLNTLFYRRGVG
jgi:FkbM family methyltransferase